MHHIVDELENQERPESFEVKANPANQGLTMANGVFNVEIGVMPGKCWEGDNTGGVYRSTVTSAGKAINTGMSTGLRLQVPGK